MDTLSQAKQTIKENREKEHISKEQEEGKEEEEQEKDKSIDAFAVGDDKPRNGLFVNRLL